MPTCLIYSIDFLSRGNDTHTAVPWWFRPYTYIPGCQQEVQYPLLFESCAHR